MNYMRSKTKPHTLPTQGWQTDPNALDQLGMEDEAEAIRMEKHQRNAVVRKNSLDDFYERERARKQK